VSYKKQMREAVRKVRKENIPRQIGMKQRVKEILGYWNQYTEAYYKKAVDYTQMNDQYQKSKTYKSYRNSYECKYRESNRSTWNYKSVKSQYKKKYGEKYKHYLSAYADKKGISCPETENV
jgi:hypothetical protein